MPALLYTINVNGPCVGEQLLNMVSPGFYAGAGGSFTYSIMFLAAPAGPWVVSIFDRSGGPCTPQVDYQQVASDPSDPVGAYHVLGPNGPDPSLGELAVNPFP